jgi:hypothetical protein
MMKLTRMGVYLAYIPIRSDEHDAENGYIASLAEVDDRLSNKEALLSEVVRYNARRISRRWAVLWRTAHWRDNSLAEVDDRLSRQRKFVVRSGKIQRSANFETMGCT